MRGARGRGGCDRGASAARAGGGKESLLWAKEVKSPAKERIENALGAGEGGRERGAGGGGRATGRQMTGGGEDGGGSMGRKRKFDRLVFRKDITG